MITHLHQYVAAAIAVAGLLLGGAVARAQPADQPDNGISVQASGPVHEAFAHPVPTTPLPGPVIPKKPPDPIPEVPPDQKPTGDNVIWIPGYWAWDDARNDYLWVSGAWRAAPLNRKWVPGYWNEVENGVQWAPGFWASNDRQDATYLEPPPASVDNGPSTPAPDDNTIYVPGCWVYGDNGFNWRPGYWTDARPGWIWTPAYYSWTPRGCVYVEGCWDLPLEDRGLLFAPVAFDQPLWATPGWTYQPWCTVPLENLLSVLWCRPSCCSYYFGDYFGDRFAGLGFSPWCEYGPRFHDPLFGYYGWEHRRDPSWYRGLHNDFLARRAGDLPRPGRTFAEQQALERQHGGRDLMRTVTPLREAQATHARLTPLSPTERESALNRANHLREWSGQRARLEQRAGPHAGGRLTLPEGPPHGAPARPHAERPAVERSQTLTRPGPVSSERPGPSREVPNRSSMPPATGRPERPQHFEAPRPQPAPMHPAQPAPQHVAPRPEAPPRPAPQHVAPRPQPAPMHQPRPAPQHAAAQPAPHPHAPAPSHHHR
jgi:hypothetical protein